MVKHKFLTLLVALIATTALGASNTIIYTATSRLSETLSEYDGGLHTDSFNVKVSSHTFSNGVGTITFAGEVTIIGERAFDGCYDMTSITIPNSVTKIGKYAFMNCWSMASINMSDNVTEFDDETFYNCSALRSIIIPSATTKIGTRAFFNCQSLTSINIPSSVTTIGERAFYGCNGLNSIRVDSTNTHYCSIDSVLFSYARDTLILYPIGNNRTEYTIPNSVTTIESYAFYSCTSLTSIICEAVVPPTCGNWCFDGMEKSIPLYVPAQSVAAYKAADGWKNFTNIQGICEGTPSFSQQDTTICGHPYPFVWEGDTVRYGGEVGHWIDTWYGFREVWSWRDRTDTITRNYISIGGCDSLLQLVVHYPHYQYSIIKDTIEEGQAYWGKYTKTGIYYDRNLNVQGCDSNVYEIHLYVQPKPVYVVTLSANSTKYGSVEGAGTYNKGDTVILSAIPNKGYQFNQWSDGNTDNPRIVIIDKDYTLTAQFGMKQCSWLVESSDLEMGAVYTDFTNEYYNYGTQITVEASANSGYKFVKWNDGKKHNPYKFSILEDKYLLAIFIAEEEEVDTTQVQPSDTTATFTWPFIVGGFTYTLTIYLDAACTIPFCTLTFNQYGQLLGITFGSRAPRRSAMANQEEGFTTTINGLSAGTQYFYKMETKDEDGKLLNTDEGGFSTQNSGVITNTEKVLMSIPCAKFIMDNQLYIRRGNEIYNATGQKVK